jgi:hypothetical protein
MENQKSWVEAICPSAVARKRTWPVIIHGVKVQDYQLDATKDAAKDQRDAWKKHATHIEKENTKLAPNRGMHWLRRTDKEYAQILTFLRQSGSRIDGISKLY